MIDNNLLEEILNKAKEVRDITGYDYKINNAGLFDITLHSNQTSSVCKISPYDTFGELLRECREGVSLLGIDPTF